MPEPIKLSISKKIKYRAEYTAVRAIAALLKLLPRKQALEVGKKLGWALFKIMGSRHRIACDNILRCFPEKSEKEASTIVRQCWENLGRGAAEFVQMPKMSRAQLESFVEFSGLEHIQNSSRQGKGVLVLTGHYGAWELGAKFWPYTGLEMAVVARKVKNPMVNDWVTKIRTTDGVKVIFSRNAVRESIQWLKQGRALSVLIDHRVTEGGLMVPFFGRPAFTSSFPAILALRYSIPVHPAHCWREGEKVIIQIAPALDFQGLTACEEHILEATQRMNAVVEEWVRRRPEHWLWIHNRWKDAG